MNLMYAKKQLPAGAAGARRRMYRCVVYTRGTPNIVNTSKGMYIHMHKCWSLSRMLVPPLAFLVRRHLDLHFRAPLLSPPFFALGPMHTLLHVLGEAKPALSHSVHLKQSLSLWSLKKVIGRRRHLYVHVVGKGYRAHP